MTTDIRNGNGHAARPPFLERLRNKIVNIVGSKAHEEIQQLVDKHANNGHGQDETLTAQEKELISAVLNFDNVTADDVAVARSDVIWIGKNDGFKEVWETFLEHQHSRMPVCGEDLDDVIGFITLKDVAPYVSQPKKFDLNTLMRKASFVPDTAILPTVLQQLRRDKVAMAIVLDEYGGTSGMLTLKDILEKLVGDIDDEHDDTAPLMIFSIGKNSYRIDPKIDLEDLDKHLGLHLSDDEETDVETLGGLVLHMAGHVPQKGETFQLTDTVSVTVQDADERRIKQLNLKITKAA